MPCKAIIVDDEQPICDEIEYLLKSEPAIEVVATFNNASEALGYIQGGGCDLVFLDIKMPGLSGLEMAQKLSSLRCPPLVIFITAYPEHALEAFETPAVGYITKPVTAVKITKILEKVRALRDKPTQPPPKLTNKLCVLSSGKIIPLSIPDIVLIYAKDKDVFVRTKTGEFAAALTLQEIEQLLTDHHFLRIHRQYIVNLDNIVEIIPWFHGSYLLRMDDYKGEEVPVSRTKIKTLKSIMGLR